MLGQSIVEEEEGGGPQQQPPAERSMEWQWHADCGNKQEVEEERWKHTVTRTNGGHQTHNVRGTTCYDPSFFFFSFIIKVK